MQYIIAPVTLLTLHNDSTAHEDGDDISPLPPDLENNWGRTRAALWGGVVTQNVDQASVFVWVLPEAISEIWDVVQVVYLEEGREGEIVAEE